MNSQINVYAFWTQMTQYYGVFTELIKSRELEKDELRPLYMDFQATTPMVCGSLTLAASL